MLDREDALRDSRARDASLQRRSSASELRRGLSDAQAAVLVAGLSIAGVLAFGTVCVKAIEGGSLATAFYWCCVSVTTVGYGDVYPTTDAGKYFACAYLLVGTVLMAKSLSDVVPGVREEL